MPTDFDSGLARNAANFVPLTPIEFLARAADVYGDRLAIVHGPVRQNWRDTYERARRLASALSLAGVGRGDTVAALLPSTPCRWPTPSLPTWPARWRWRFPACK